VRVHSGHSENLMPPRERAGKFHGLVERLRGRAGAEPDREPSPDSDLDLPSEGDVTGNTVFGARLPLLRNLTGEPVDVSLSLSDPVFQADAFKIRLAGSRASNQQAGTLVERRYAWRGYQVPGLVADPNLRTFVAYREGAPVGTVSIRIDSAKGLSADDLYKAELEELRSDGARLCEFTRLAVEEEAVYKNVLGGLFHTAYMYAHDVRECDYGVIEVNPRHAVFYRRTVFFELIGSERMNQRVNAPSVLLCVSFEKIRVELKKYFEGPTKPPGRLMFAHWFPPDEAAGVLGRLRGLEP
jgi:hypothetical protein